MSVRRTSVFPNVFGRLIAGNDLKATSLSMKNYRSEVLRDLGWLLNTSCHPRSSSVHHYPEVASSTLNFGMLDFVGVDLASIDPDAVADAIRESIIRFEPRISKETLRVEVAGDAWSGDSDRITIEITGDLWALPASEPLALLASWNAVAGSWTFE